MTSGIRFLGCSGVLGNAENGVVGPTPPGDENLEVLEIFDVTVSPGDTSSPLRLGFFGADGAPDSAVIVDSYQDRSVRVDHFGNPVSSIQEAQLINVKFTGASTAEVSGVSFPNMEDIPSRSGTIMARFLEPNGSAVVTQNAFLRAITITSSSGALTGTLDRPSDVVLYGTQLQDTHGNAGDSSWTLLADTDGAPTDLSLNNQTGESTVHDWYLGLSASPKTTGRKRLFGWLFQIEYL